MSRGCQLKLGYRGLSPNAHINWASPEERDSYYSNFWKIQRDDLMPSPNFSYTTFSIMVDDYYDSTTGGIDFGCILLDGRADLAVYFSVIDVQYINDNCFKVIASIDPFDTLTPRYYASNILRRSGAPYIRPEFSATPEVATVIGAHQPSADWDSFLIIAGYMEVADDFDPNTMPNEAGIKLMPMNNGQQAGAWYRPGTLPPDALVNNRYWSNYVSGACAVCSYDYAGPAGANYGDSNIVGWSHSGSFSVPAVDEYDRFNSMLVIQDVQGGAAISVPIEAAINRGLGFTAYSDPFAGIRTYSFDGIGASLSVNIRNELPYVSTNGASAVASARTAMVSQLIRSGSGAAMQNASRGYQGGAGTSGPLGEAGGLFSGISGVIAGLGAGASDLLAGGGVDLGAAIQDLTVAKNTGATDLILAGGSGAANLYIAPGIRATLWTTDAAVKAAWTAYRQANGTYWGGVYQIPAGVHDAYYLGDVYPYSPNTTIGLPCTASMLASIKAQFAQGVRLVSSPSAQNNWPL